MMADATYPNAWTSNPSMTMHRRRARTPAIEPCGAAHSRWSPWRRAPVERDRVQSRSGHRIGDVYVVQSRYSQRRFQRTRVPAAAV